MRKKENQPPTEPHAWENGREQMDRMYGDLALRCRQWMTAALAAMAASTVLAVGIATLAVTDKDSPYVVEVDRFGEIRAVGDIAVQKVPERARRATLFRTIKHMREIPSDARILSARHETALAHMSDNAAEVFAENLAASADALNEMLQRGRTRYVTELKSLLPFPDRPNMYRVTWAETGGGADQSYEGFFQIQDGIQPTPQQALHNPLGIFIANYSISTLTTDEE